MTVLHLPSEERDLPYRRQSPATIAILGLGNLLRSDDGVGVHAVRKMEADSRVPSGVQMIEGGTHGLDLLPALYGASHVLALDAVDTGHPPGTLSRFVDAALDDLPVARSVHLLGFADLLNALRLVEHSPAEVVLLGVQPESTAWGLTLSGSVAAALDSLVEAALVQLFEWGQPAL